MKETTLTLTKEHHTILKEFLFPEDGNQSVAIALCTRRDGDRRTRLLVNEIQLIPYEQCLQRTSCNVSWSLNSILDLIEKAKTKKLTVMKIQSRLRKLTNEFPPDKKTDASFVSQIYEQIGGATIHGCISMVADGTMVGEVYDRDLNSRPLDRIMAIGDNIEIWHHDLSGASSAEFGISHASLFGEKTIQEFSQLSVGVVGCSGTGGPLIEQLYRNGVGELVLVDEDIVKIRNLNRIPNTYMSDALLGRSKVETLTERIGLAGLGTRVIPIRGNLWTTEAVLQIAQCDIVFGCMDSIDGRFLLNTLAACYLIPYFDLGVRLQAHEEGAKKGQIREACGTVHYLRPGKSSLMSRGLISMDAVRSAGLKRNDLEAHKQQMDEGYILGVQEARPAVITVNMFLSSLAVHELLCRLHPYREEPNEKYARLEFSLAAMEFFPEYEREQDCCEILRSLVGKGDVSPLLNLPALS